MLLVAAITAWITGLVIVAAIIYVPKLEENFGGRVHFPQTDLDQIQNATSSSAVLFVTTTSDSNPLLVTTTMTPDQP